MQFDKFFPIATTHDLEAVRHFYCTYLGFVVTMDHPDFLGLRSAHVSADGKAVAEIAFARADKNRPLRPPSEGWLLYGLQVKSADAEHERLVSLGVPIHQVPRNEPWGERSLVILDPVGTWIYIYEVLPSQTGA